MNPMNNNPFPPHRKRAVAIQYNPEDAAPKIMAKGTGLVAEKIISTGKNSDIHVHKDASLADELTRMDLGASIPPELYEVVAQILIFVSDLDRTETMKSYALRQE